MKYNFKPKRLLLVLIVLIIMFITYNVFSFIDNGTDLKTEVYKILITIMFPVLLFCISFMLPGLVIILIKIIGFEFDFDWIGKFFSLFEWFWE